MASKRGRGCIYQRGEIWWVKYSVEGKAYQESSRSTKPEDAKRLLKRRLGEIVGERLVGSRLEKVLLRELCEDVITDYQTNRKRSLIKLKRSVRHLLQFFGEIQAQRVTTDKVKDFIASRQAYGISNAEINRELAALKRAFNLGIQAEKIARKLYIPMLKEHNVREGFFEPEEFLTVRNALPNYIRPVMTFAYITSWRKKEILGLQWHQVDRSAGMIRIALGLTKGEEGRAIFLEGELRAVIEEQWKVRRLDCPYVFHRKGKQMQGFRKAWEKALDTTGLQGKLFHDLRRTAIRNMVRAGIPERVAMMISGHRTRSVFERYNIVSGKDLKTAAQAIEAYNQEQTVTKTVTVLPL